MFWNNFPPAFPGSIGTVFTAIQILAVVTSFGAEANPETRTPYSKFSAAKHDSSSWSSRFAMMVIYTPAFIASVGLLALGLYGVDAIGPITVPAPSLAAFLSAVHFCKRCLEVTFLHKYSGCTSRGTPAFISVYYTFVTLLIAHASGGMDRDVSNTAKTFGVAIFAIGIAGNFYHHYLLARLRSGNNGSTESKKYVAPRGGLFAYVATPHYLFELIGWLGIAIVSNHLNSYLIFATMCSYLAGRSVAQNEFNRANFKDWPIGRKNLIPFVF
ncbi:hypothetical protein ACHAXA_010894 [Cyclostephanos tholiformis]|uniref:3-oxo-5-alpha-steroid 4-dehydrogenase C-terminal domain-containing protein n=1 Tax=Cyclostephanos tholiformis TaxID=382380 RepID=A0ABD3R718_9STRA